MSTRSADAQPKRRYMTLATLPQVPSRLGQGLLRLLRRALPFPGGWARAFGKAVPAGCYTSARYLRRPESLCFSGDGELLAVSNSAGASVGVFGVEIPVGGLPAITLREIVCDGSVLEYAHGATFVQGDGFLLCVGEHSQALSTIRLSRQTEAGPGPRVLWSQCGCDNGLDNPADIAMHPSGDWCVVANRKFTGLSFFSLPESLEDKAPAFRTNVDVGVLNQRGIAAPHGVGFSATGERMFVTHKRFTGWGYRGGAGRSGVSVWNVAQGYPSAPEDLLAFEDYEDAHLHHVACHPRLPYVAVSNSRGNAEVLYWDESRRKLYRVDSIDVFRIGEGAKGVAFTPDGHFIALSTELAEVLFFPFRLDGHHDLMPRDGEVSPATTSERPV